MKRAVLLLMCLLAAPSAFAKKEKIRHYPMGRVKDWYVVMLSAETSAEAFEGVVQSLASTYGLSVTTRWQFFKGFLAQAPIENVERLAADPCVASIEQDHLGEAPPALSGRIYTDPGTAGADPLVSRSS